MLLELVREALSGPKALRSTEVAAQIRAAARQTIERGELLRPETAREARTRQTQGLSHRAHADACEPIEHLLGPAQRGQRQRGERAAELRLAQHLKRSA